MPTSSCPGVHVIVGLPATAGGAETTGARSGGTLSTITVTGAVVNVFPAGSVMTAESVIGPSGGRFPAAPPWVFQRPPVPSTIGWAATVAPVQLHATLVM